MRAEIPSGSIGDGIGHRRPRRKRQCPAARRKHEPRFTHLVGGQLLRDRGYAEIVSVAGQYHMDNDGGLVLVTEYDIMSSVERFWFPSPNVRVRSSTVKRMGGFSTATFCTETRVLDANSEPIAEAANVDPQLILSPLGW